MDIGTKSTLSEEAMGMSRNSSGNYALPTGNPVVTGTTITSDWANETLGDLASEMTDSLNRSGKGAMLAPLKATDGTAAAPSVTFSNDPDTGLYRPSDNTAAVAAGSTQVQRWAAGGTTITGTLSSNSGALDIPSGVTSAGASTFSGGLSTTGGLTATTSAVNAITATGSGGGSGLVATGGGTSGPAITATGGAPNGYGIRAFGTGTGWGVEGIGGTSSSGAQGTGGIFSPGTAATATARTNAIVAYQGDLLFSAVSNPNSNVAISNTLTPKNVVKAWARLSAIGSGSTTVNVNDGFNIASASASGSALIVVLASAFSSVTNYAIIATSSNGTLMVSAAAASASSLTISARDVTAAGALHDFQAYAGITVVNIIVIGSQ